MNVLHNRPSLICLLLLCYLEIAFIFGAWTYTIIEYLVLPYTWMSVVWQFNCYACLRLRISGSNLYLKFFALAVKQLNAIPRSAWKVNYGIQGMCTEWGVFWNRKTAFEIINGVTYSYNKMYTRYQHVVILVGLNIIIITFDWNTTSYIT